MITEQKQLASKRKKIVNLESFYNLARLKGPVQPVVQASYYESFLDHESYEKANNVLYFKSEFQDKVRIVLGKNWDFRVKDPNEVDASKKQFSNSWPRPKVFGAQFVDWSELSNGWFHISPITLGYCQEVPDEIYGAGSYGLTGAVIKQKLTLQTKDIPTDTLPGIAGNAKPLREWVYFIKSGAITEENNSYEPIIKTGKYFFDHAHESINPFTPDELAFLQPAIGKTFFADFKTNYNERVNSLNFENVVGPQIDIQNSLPSIYGFLRLFLNKDLIEQNVLDFSSILKYLKVIHEATDAQELKNIYKETLKGLPLESLTTLYGAIGHNHDQNDILAFDETKIVEKIFSMNFDNIDADSLFSDYYNEYTDLISKDEKLDIVSSASSAGLQEDYNKMLALERVMSNFVFSPNTIKLMNKVDQYKKYFPFYAELNFSANILTSLGDLMKQFSLTKVFSETILSSQAPVDDSSLTSYSDSWTSGYINQRNYVDYAEEKIYETLTTGIAGEVEISENGFIQTVKKSLDIPSILETWINSDDSKVGIYNSEQSDIEDFSKTDLRNYITYFKNDFEEPGNIEDDCNALFKALFGSAFYANILSLYKKHRRDYKQIMDGAPAYAEDLFYRIEKIKKDRDPLTGQVSSDEKVVQNILVPNTSDLDIVKYVDTQLKYSTYAVYEYRVFVHRIVFGSKYQYFWLNQDDQVVTDAAGQPYAYEKKDISDELVELPAEYGAGIGVQNESNGLGTVVTSQKFSAAFQVRIEPSIIMIEDKIFSTPNVMIMDKPPVMPDVNIIPYRGISNRIKILLTGASDRYRSEPVIILDSDEEKFNVVAEAQLSYDGKVEFGSDDPVNSFQIFRIEKKPTSYSDFELYEQISEQFYEEQILPNTKYYYTFRAIDAHEHISNPTPVYEVELIDEKGAVKPIIRLIELEKPETKTNTKDCRKYIYLKPTEKQLFFSDIPEVDGVFSNNDNKKKYKMRLTSKGSGKKIDINFSFKKKTD